MLRKDVKWYYPETFEDALAYLKQPNVILHAGGTGILRTKSTAIEGFVDLSKLKLDFINETESEIEIGAMVTFNKVIEHFNKGEGKTGLLKKSLELAASHPLRNRITIGGSIVDFQPWSDLMAPLFAIDANAVIFGNDGLVEIKVIELVKRMNELKPFIIKSIKFKNEKDYYFFVNRLVRVNFDYAAFNISALLKIDNKIVKSSKIFITGIVGRFRELTDLESYLQDKVLDDNLINEIDNHLYVEFTRDYRFSAAYKDKALKIFIKDGLNEIKNQIMKKS